MLIGMSWAHVVDDREDEFSIKVDNSFSASEMEDGAAPVRRSWSCKRLLMLAGAVFLLGGLVVFAGGIVAAVTGWPFTRRQAVAMSPSSGTVNLLTTSQNTSGNRCELPSSFSCRAVKELPHSTGCFTEGLEAWNPFGPIPSPSQAVWLESGGLYGMSKLSGLTEAGQEVFSWTLPREVFAEGVTSLQGKLFQLTWKEDMVFVYNSSDLRGPRIVKGVLSQFQTKEGWGLTNDGEHLIASDGSDKLYILTPGNLSVVSVITVPGNDPLGNRISQINELEYNAGFVFFNIWMQDFIGILDLASQQVVGWLDCKELVTQQRASNGGADVLNGIAFNRPQDGFRRLVVTGKFWNKMYELDFQMSTGPCT